MCHTVIAQRICKDCRHSLGETVIDFTRCARKCSSPFYCLTPEPQMELCNLCTATATLSTPVLAQHALEDTTTAAAAAAASAGARLYDHSIAKAAAYPGPGAQIPGEGHSTGESLISNSSLVGYGSAPSSPCSAGERAGVRLPVGSNFMLNLSGYKVSLSTSNSHKLSSLGCKKCE
ncbi:hypothetical protein DER44DRAFT_804908 [Fusarium oxysporum]|nr:hypothetical protein DER44DRAFT_804908 [Fusarium oxysporum]